MITFYPGPSKIYPQVERYLLEAFHSDLLSMNHRSRPFMDMLSQTIAALKNKLAIPQSYEVVFTSSATECWEIVAQSLTPRLSYHVYNGAFGQKWQEYAHRIHRKSKSYPYSPNDQPHPDLTGHDLSDILCLTHTETSNGTSLTNDSLKRLRNVFKGIVAIDATSSMGGMALPWKTADIWFASVQKCFGLPSGLAVMVLSPTAAERAELLGERAYYNSLAFIVENFRKSQTPYTPNILGIFLLGRLMSGLEPIQTTSRRLDERSAELYDFLEKNGFQPLIRNKESRSPTVVTVEETRESIDTLKTFAAQRNLILGNGYGDQKATTFRIANFPAIGDAEFDELKKCLLDFNAARQKEK